ncbi:MAG: DUF983 domain-containing protein, partial [Bacteroidota bacterium]
QTQSLTERKRSGLSSIVGGRCPRCRTGKLFVTRNPYDLRSTLKMPEQCSHCGQDFRIEPGFYFGATYVSYGLNIALLVAIGVAISVLGTLTFWNFTLSWIGAAVVLTPMMARLARTIWIHAFVRYKSPAERSKS